MLVRFVGFGGLGLGMLGNRGFRGLIGACRRYRGKVQF